MTCPRCAELGEALRDMFRMMDEGLLVRDTSKDNAPGWAMAAIAMVSRLKEAHGLAHSEPVQLHHPPRENMAPVWAEMEKALKDFVDFYAIPKMTTPLVLKPVLNRARAALAKAGK